jgi:hypothetical protein
MELMKKLVLNIGLLGTLGELTGGENGFFRIRMHKHNLGIEELCNAPYPSHNGGDTMHEYYS